MTEHFINHEIAHLTRMMRSAHWHGSRVWTVAYWRSRIERLREAPVVSPSQEQALDALLAELKIIEDVIIRRAVRTGDVARRDSANLNDITIATP